MATKYHRKCLGFARKCTIFITHKQDIFTHTQSPTVSHLTHAQSTLSVYKKVKKEVLHKAISSLMMLAATIDEQFLLPGFPNPAENYTENY